MTRTNILPIVLPKPLYKQLEREAYAQDRDPLQQARWILKQALETSPNDPASLPDPKTAASDSARWLWLLLRDMWGDPVVHMMWDCAASAATSEGES